MKRKALKFRKQEIADLTREEQNSIIGGNAPTVGYCTDTCVEEGCMPTYGQTGDCPSRYDGADCDQASVFTNYTCAWSALEACHSDRDCTYGYCTDGCPNTWGDPTCDC